MCLSFQHTMRGRNNYSSHKQAAKIYIPHSIVVHAGIYSAVVWYNIISIYVIFFFMHVMYVFFVQNILYFMTRGINIYLAYIFYTVYFFIYFFNQKCFSHNFRGQQLMHSGEENAHVNKPQHTQLSVFYLLHENNYFVLRHNILQFTAVDELYAKHGYRFFYISYYIQLNGLIIYTYYNLSICIRFQNASHSEVPIFFFNSSRPSKTIDKHEYIL